MRKQEMLYIVFQTWKLHKLNIHVTLVLFRMFWRGFIKGTGPLPLLDDDLFDCSHHDGLFENLFLIFFLLSQHT